MTLFQQEERMDSLDAFEAIQQFALTRGEFALRLAMHAAVPQTFRPDLLHLIRRNFLIEASNDTGVEADVLFSPLCKDLGDEYFTFDEEVRIQLLDSLASAYRHESTLRVRHVANLILRYVDQCQLQADSYRDRVYMDYLEIQRWVAHSFLNPHDAAHQLALALKQTETQPDTLAITARVQLGGVASAISLPLSHERDLLVYAAGLQALELRDTGRAKRLLGRLGDRKIEVEGVELQSAAEVLGEKTGRKIRTVESNDVSSESPVEQKTERIDDYELTDIDFVAEESIEKIDESLIDDKFALEVGQIMVSRIGIVAISTTMSANEVENLIQKTRLYHFPLYEEHLDNILGVLYASDILTFMQNNVESHPDWKVIAREPLFVSESKVLDELLSEFDGRNVVVAIVLDEHGRTTGLVTRQDVQKALYESESLRQELKDEAPQEMGSAIESEEFEYDVFFSFIPSDLEIVLPVYEQLTANGLRIYMPTINLDQEFEVGEKPTKMIDESLDFEIGSCRHMVVFWTIDAELSGNLKPQYENYLNRIDQARDRLLIPILIGEQSPLKLPQPLNSLQSLFFSEEDESQFIVRLGNWLGFEINIESKPIVKGLPKTLTDDHGIEFILIEPGTFMMGSEKGTDDDERPVHEVEITRPFYLGKYQVTQAQWEAINRKNPSRFKGEKHPVESVSWNDVQKFLKKLQKGEGVYRLPTEAEWEYACRAGTTTEYSFGDDEKLLGDYAWYTSNSGGSTHTVGQKKPNPWGLYDMHGNVREWVQDWFDSGYYKQFHNKTAVDPIGPEKGTNRVIRGGSWGAIRATYLRSACRFYRKPGDAYGSIGFRLLRTIP